jgi:hypothetical protein
MSSPRICIFYGVQGQDRTGKGAFDTPGKHAGRLRLDAFTMICTCEHYSHKMKVVLGIDYSKVPLRSHYVSKDIS